MNPEKIIELQNKVTNLEESISDISKVINVLKIDSQLFLKRNVDIPPGIATKIAYDKNGLVIDGNKLKASDIPEITIDGVKDLRRILDEKVTKYDLSKSLESNLSLYNNAPGDIVNTGCKINYDANGRIVSSANLAIDDLPDISITDILDLSDELDLIKSQLISPSTVIEEKTVKIEPGTFSKISFDENGHVIAGNKLSMDDIPVDITIRLNEIENKLPNFASQKTVAAMNNSISKKLDANEYSIKSGTFLKVTVDSKGLVINGDSELTKKDLPELSIDDIIGLEFKLRSKADQDTLIDLTETVSMLVSNMDKIGNVLALESKIESKAEDRDLKEIQIRMKSIQTLMDTLSNKIPNDVIMEQLQNIQNELSSLSGRISTIERKMNMNDSFDTE